MLHSCYQSSKMNNKNYIDCLRQNKDEKEGTLFMRSKGRENKKKKSLKIKVSYDLFKKHWNSKDQCFKSSMSNYKMLNAEIGRAYTEVEKFNGVIADIPKDGKSFIQYWQQLIKLATNHGSRIKHQTVLNKLKKYLATVDKTDLKFSEITPGFLRELQFHLSTAADPKTLSLNQVTHSLKIIKTIINNKLIEEPYIYSIHPFASIKLDFNPDDIKRTILPQDDIDKLLKGSIENNVIDLHRNMLLFEIFAGGMRVSDLMLLRWNMIKTGEKSTDARIEYKMFKTGKTMSIPLSINLCKILLKLICKESVLENTGDPLIKRVFPDYNKTPQGIERDIIITNNEIEIFVNKNDCATDFIFPHIPNELFKSIDKDNDFDRVTADQYQGLMNAEILFNRQLKVVGKSLGIKHNLSSHAGRHTFTQLLMNDDIQTHLITQALGHSSVKVTDHYIRNKFNKEKGDSVINQIANNSSNRKG